MSTIAPTNPTTGSSEDRRAPSASVVIFGASGDLTRRKLLPALDNLYRQQRLAPGALIGVARSPLGDDGFQDRVSDAVGEDLGRTASVHYVGGSYDDPATYVALRQLLDRLETEAGVAGNRLFYLATPPEAFAPVVQGLAGAGLTHARPGGFARLVVEKPYGRDLASARELDALVHAAFDETQVFRIDHYLGKDTVQNLLALRFANSIFQPIWNRTWIDHVQITVAETLGVEGRGGFYEHAGAMRDIMQNHVLQVLALALMEPPASFSPEAIRNEKVKLLESIRVPSCQDIHEIAVRGQYAASEDGEVTGYRDEPGVSPTSRTETFAALCLNVDNWRWAGVPFYVRTGKRLPRRVTEVVLQFQRPPHLPIPSEQLSELAPDALILRIQPDEGISLRFGAKIPGHDFRVRSARMEFSYGDAFAENSPEAYERLLLDALLGDATLFIRSDEVEQSWRIVDPIITRWANDDDTIPQYPAHTWGPHEAELLVARGGRRWHHPL